MEYRKFIIENYRGITGPAEVNCGKHHFIPIVGLNESGKTSVLEGIFSFDQYNDEQSRGQHLLNAEGQWHIAGAPEPLIAAVVGITQEEFETCLRSDSINQSLEGMGLTSFWESFRDEVTITRSLRSYEYRMFPTPLDSTSFMNALGRELVRNLPYIHYFNAQREIFPSSIELAGDRENYQSDWQRIIDRLLAQADLHCSIFDLSEMPLRNRRDRLEIASRTLTRTLISEWQAFRFTNSDDFAVELEFVGARRVGNRTADYLDIHIVERDADGNSHRFSLDARSHGFQWFFSFAMRLRFNNRHNPESSRSIYLFDEPASYLHSSAQTEWCRVFKQLAETHTIIYSTHSQFLLDPRYVPVKNILFAERSPANGTVAIVPFHDFKCEHSEQRHAMQPILEALRVQPFVLQVSSGIVIVVEGIYDYYAYMLFQRERRLIILPATNADSIRYHVSQLIAWDFDFRVVWDADTEGRQRLEEAKGYFGEEISQRRFFTLPARTSAGRRILQDLFDGPDITFIKTEVGLNQNVAFEKVVLTLFYHPEKDRIVDQLPGRTRSHFDEVFTMLGV